MSNMSETENTEAVDSPCAATTLQQAAQADDALESYLKTEPMEIRLGRDLIPLADPQKGGDLLDRIHRVRKEIASEIGIICPRVRIRDLPTLGKTHYEIHIDGGTVARWSLFPNRYLAIPRVKVPKKVRGIKTTEPAYGTPALWVKEASIERAKKSGYTVVEPNAVIATHFLEIVRKHADVILTLDGTQALLDALEQENPVVVREAKNVLSLAQIQYYLRMLLQERIPIKRLGSILEVLGGYSRQADGIQMRDPTLVMTLVRTRLARTHCSQREDKTAPDEALADALGELNALVGLESVKAEVRSFVAFLKIQKERERQKLKTDTKTLHYVFTGNPGTGKTSVARILAKILYGYGILQSDKFTEVDRSGLVAGYLGQTALKTDEAIQNALDGVLFIDEAYSLGSDERARDSFGHEAIETLLKRMEDYRSRLVVIVAGYTEPMAKFLKSNPGLSSRFTRFLHFDDYSTEELTEIFLKLCNEGEYRLTESALGRLREICTEAVAGSDEHFGNGRYVRNLFEKATMRQSARLGALKTIARKQLLTIEAEDIAE